MIQPIQVVTTVYTDGSYSVTGTNCTPLEVLTYMTDPNKKVADQYLHILELDTPTPLNPPPQ